MQAIPTAPARHTTPRTGKTRSRRLLRAIAVACAVLATATIWVIAVPVAAVQLSVRTGAHAADQHIGLAAIVTVSLLTGLAAWALLASLERFTTRPLRVWIMLAILTLVISLAGPLVEGTTVTTKLVLLGMHLAVGATVIPALAKTMTRR